MSAWISTRLMAMDRRVLIAMAGALVLFIVAQAWLLVLRTPVAEWRALAAQGLAEKDAAVPGAAAAEISRLTQAIEHAEAELRGAVSPRSDDDTVLFLISALSPLAASHGVALDAVRASGRRVEPEFTAAAFDVEARGAYLALSTWLHDAQAQIAPLTVSELSLNASDAGRQVTLKMKLSAYAPTPPAPGGPQ